MHNLLLVDQSYLLHIAYYSFPELYFRERYTGGVYGYLRFLCSYIEFVLKLHTAPLTVASCQDLKPYNRTLILSDYKGNRSKDEVKASCLSQSKVLLDTVLHYAPIYNVCYPGLEADDIISVFSKKYKNRFENIFILSNDTDLFQLLDQDNIRIIRGRYNDPSLYDKSQFFKDYPELPNAQVWSRINAMTGGHNNLPGIDGIGIKKAVKYYTGGKLGKADLPKIASNIARIENHYRLTLLPPIDRDYFSLLSLDRRGAYDPEGLYDTLVPYGFSALDPFNKTFKKIA